MYLKEKTKKVQYYKLTLQIYLSSDGLDNLRPKGVHVPRTSILQTGKI